MKLIEFVPMSGEKVIAELRPNRKWYIIVWRGFIGLVNITVITFLAYTFLATPLLNFFNGFLAESLSNILTSIIIFGLLPMVITAWVTDDLAKLFIGLFVLTDQRFWIRGSPSSWNHSEIAIEDISSMAYRRDAIFLRQKSNRKIHVHMVSDGQVIVEAYRNLIKE